MRIGGPTPEGEPKKDKTEPEGHSLDPNSAHAAPDGFQAKAENPKASYLESFTSRPHPEDLEGESPMAYQIQSRSQSSLNKGLEAALGAAPTDVREALEVTHEALRNLGVPHVLVGGLAVGVHGFPHSTPDVDYLVEEDKAFNPGVLLTFRNGIPIRSGKVDIDYLTVEGPEVVKRKMWECLERAARNPEEVVVAPPDLLTFMKLKAGRAKDKSAIVELLKAGMDVKPVRAFLEEAADSDVLARFEGCVTNALEERD